MQRDFDVLYTSFEQDGAIAEVYSLLSLQPVFPSKEHWFAYKLLIDAKKILKLADFSALSKLGVEAARYMAREYRLTQEIPTWHSFSVMRA